MPSFEVHVAVTQQTLLHISILSSGCGGLDVQLLGRNVQDQMEGSRAGFLVHRQAIGFVDTITSNCHQHRVLLEGN